MKPLTHRLAAWLVCATAALSLPNGHAAVSFNADDPGNLDGTKSEFFLTIWDTNRKASYTLDLGLHVDTLLGTGQSDAGFQRFWVLDGNTDANLKKLLDLGTPTSQLQWGVYAVDAIGTIFDPGTLNLYTTLRHDSPTGTVDPDYTRLTHLGTDVFGAYTEGTLPSEFLVNLNTNANGSPDNSHSPNVTAADYLRNGSSFAREGESYYWGRTGTAGEPVIANFGSASIPSMTVIGRSSWAYRLTSDAAGAADPTSNPVLVAEFENLTHDAYWGLAVNPADGTLALSYTLEAVAPSATALAFARAIGRTESDGGFVTRRLDGTAVSSSETAAGFGNRVLLGSADAEFAPTASPVPEPGAWALWATGVAGLGAWARRHRRLRA